LGRPGGGRRQRRRKDACLATGCVRLARPGVYSTSFSPHCVARELQPAQQSFVKVNGLTLFDYLKL
jgi:hypothetical protein